MVLSISTGLAIGGFASKKTYEIYRNNCGNQLNSNHTLFPAVWEFSSYHIPQKSYPINTIDIGAYPWILQIILYAAIGGLVRCNGIIYYHSRVYHSVRTYFQETLNLPASNKIIANYFISYDTIKCCPVLLLGYNSWVPPQARGYFSYCFADSRGKWPCTAPSLLLPRLTTLTLDVGMKGIALSVMVPEH